MKRVKKGDTFAIQLGESDWAIGIVLHVSTHFKLAMLVSFFDYLYPSRSSFDPLNVPKMIVSDDPKGLPNYTAKRLIYDGIWLRFGHHVELADAIGMPEMYVANSVYVGDSVFDNRYNAFQSTGLQRILVDYGYVALENTLKEHFGLLPPRLSA